MTGFVVQSHKWHGMSELLGGGGGGKYTDNIKYKINNKFNITAMNYLWMQDELWKEHFNSVRNYLTG